IFIVLLVGLPPSAMGATFTVDSTADAVDANPGDGHCATAAGQCTLRAAVQEANTTPGADTIMVPAGTYNLKLPGIDEDAAATGASVTIRDSMLVGNHAGHNSGGIEIDDGTADLTRVVIAKNGGLNESGGVEVSASTVTLSDCIIRGNRGVTDAGGIENEDG